MDCIDIGIRKSVCGKNSIPLSKLSWNWIASFCAWKPELILYLILIWKKLSLCHKPWISYLCNQCKRSFIFRTINSVRSNTQSLKNQRSALSGTTDKGIRKIGFVAKSQFLCFNFTGHGFSWNQIQSKDSITIFNSKKTD